MNSLRVLTIALLAAGLVVTGAFAATRPKAEKVDRGKVTAFSATSVTLQLRNGGTATFAITSTTRVRGTLAVGARAIVASTGGTAVAIRVGAKQRAAAGPFGGAVHIEYRITRRDGTVRVLTLDRGKITATGSTLTLLRPDNVSVSFTVDSSTKVRGTIAVDARASVLAQNGRALRVRVAGAKTRNR